ncbi:MAG: ABC transporter permease [Candidatus Cloacimonadota bacterium]|nr:MAG: ABC transporter permease [Candidatus Cloacimonadota bacterium]
MKVVTIALNTYRESIRDKVLYGLVLFSIIFIGASRILKPLTIGEELKVTKDMGLASISFFGLLIAVFIGTRLLYEEIEKKTIYTIISKPLKRWQFLLGKYIGLLLVILTVVIIMTLWIYLVLWLTTRTFDVTLLLGIFYIFLELMVITAISLFFSTFSTPIMSGLITFMLYFTGHLTRDILIFAELTKSRIVTIISHIIYFILPNLSNFNIKGEIVHKVPLETAFLLYSLSYGILYTIFLLLLSVIIFQKRDF